MESTIIEITNCGRKWVIIGAPSMLNCTFIHDCLSFIDRLHVRVDNIIVIGDLNNNPLKLGKSQPLHKVCYIFDFTNIIPKCFMKDAHPSVLDAFVTYRSSVLIDVTHFTLLAGTI